MKTKTKLGPIEQFVDETYVERKTLEIYRDLLQEDYRQYKDVDGLHPDISEREYFDKFFDYEIQIETLTTILS